MIVKRRTYRKQGLEFVSSTLEQPQNVGNAELDASWSDSMTKGKQSTQNSQEQPYQQPHHHQQQQQNLEKPVERSAPRKSSRKQPAAQAPPSNSGSIMSKTSRKRTLVRRRKHVSCSSEQQKCSRPVALLPLPWLHLRNCSAAVGGGGFSSSTQQNHKQHHESDDAWENRASGYLESDYSSDDSSAHSEEYFRQQQQQQLQHLQTTRPPPQASSAVAQLIEDKVVRLQVERVKQVEHQRRVQEEREKGEWMSYNIRLSIDLQARRAEEARRAAKKRAAEAKRAAEIPADEAKQAEEIAATKAERVDEAAICLKQNKAVLERNLQFAKHRARRDEIDHGHINVNKNKSALQDQLNFSQHQALTFKELEIATRTQTIPKKAKKVVTEEKVEFDKIGKITPSLASMIAQAALELRPIPKEHKKEFKPICNDAAEIGKFMRLKEKVVEAQGTRTGVELEKIFKKESASTAIKPWTRGVGTVTLPKFDNVRSEAFNIVNEAAALGRLVALKPKVTRNYDEELDYLDDEETDDVDVLAVDENGHKDFRMKYLTDIHVRHHQKEKKKYWDITNLDQTSHDDLDMVELPTGALPVYNKGRKQLSLIEIKEGIAQGVAEKLWERQYRLERPEAELRMRPACACKYCKTSNPYQTHAYRKKWLIRQGLWVEPEEEPGLRHAKSRADPLMHLRKRLVVEKKKEEEIRREAERQKWLVESKHLYSKSRLKQIIEKEPPVLDTAAEAVEQRIENLKAAHQRAKVIIEKTAPVPVALGESVSARKKKLFSTGMSENGKNETAGAAETAWERDHKGRWIARTGGEKSASEPEWVNKSILRHVSSKSKTTSPPTSSDNGATMSPNDLTIKPDNVNNSVKGVVQAQPTKRRIEFLNIHLKPPSLRSPWSPRSAKSSKPPKSPNKLSPRPPRSANAEKLKKPVVKKSLREQLAEKRREILKSKAPLVPKDVRLKPVAKLPPSLKEVPQQPGEKTAAFHSVLLKSRSVPLVPIIPDLLTALKGVTATSTTARNALSDSQDEEDFVEEEWSGSGEAVNTASYDEEEVIDETIHDEDYGSEHYIGSVVEKEIGEGEEVDDDEYTEIFNEDDEDYTEIEESETPQSEESSVDEFAVSRDVVNVDAGIEEYYNSKELDDKDNGDDNRSYDSDVFFFEDDEASVDSGKQECLDQSTVGHANSFHLTPLLRRQSLQLIKDVREIMKDGYRAGEANKSPALEDSGVPRSSMRDDSGIQGLSEFEDSRTQSPSLLDDSGVQSSSEVEERISLPGQKECSFLEAQEAKEGEDSMKVQEGGTAEDHHVTGDKVEDSPIIQVSVSDDHVNNHPHNVVETPKDTSKESSDIQHESRRTEKGRERMPNDRKKGRRGIFKQLGSTFASMLGR